MSQISVNNYLVPAVGRPSAIVEKFFADVSTPKILSFKMTKLDGANFIPSGVYLTSKANDPVIVTIAELGDFTFVVQPGKGVNYPAPLDQTISIVGGGEDVVMVFVNYPII